MFQIRAPIISTKSAAATTQTEEVSAMAANGRGKSTIAPKIARCGPRCSTMWGPISPPTTPPAAPAVSNRPCPAALKPKISWLNSTKTVRPIMLNPLMSPRISASCKITGWSRVQRQASRRAGHIFGCDALVEGGGGRAIIQTSHAASAKVTASTAKGIGKA